MADAVLSIENSCLGAYAFGTHFAAVLNALLKKWKEKSLDAAFAVLCVAYKHIHVSET